jgi:multidrug resistance efflux pump
MRGRWFVLLGSAALVTVGLISLYFWRHAVSARQPAPVPAKAAPAVYAGNDATFEGKIQALAVQSIGAPIEGKIEAFHAEPGDEVFEGQLLAQLRSAALDTDREKASIDADQARSRLTDLEAEIVSARLEAARAEADAGRARSDFERAAKAWERQKMLLEAGATPRLTAEKAQRDYETASREQEAVGTLARNAQSRFESLQAELEGAKKLVDEKQQDLDHALSQVASGEVHSPVNGVVVSRRGQPGDDVNRSMQDLFVVATDLSHLEVVLEPPPPVLARMHAGQQAAITVAETPSPLSGQVKSVDQGKVVVEFANPDPVVKPGLTARVRIVF